VSEIQLLKGMSGVAERYDALFCDVWGVIHDGRRAFGPACDALAAFRQKHGPVILITNAPVPKAMVTRLFAPLGVPMDCFDEVVTSGDATRAELKRFGPGPVYPIGVLNDRSVYAGLDVSFTDDPSAAAVVCCTSLREYPGGDPQDYREELGRLVDARLTMVCANPDVQFRHGDRLIWAAGALAEIYESLGGEVIRPGKPDAPIYNLARREAERLAGHAIERARILAIGDGPATDLLGAQRQNLDSLFVVNGVAGRALASGGDAVEIARDALGAANVTSTYVMRELAW
jgi:HAD superfamily hydrolase (TIGR01459 family)